MPQKMVSGKDNLASTRFSRYIILIVFLAIAKIASAQVVINEITASNASGIQDEQFDDTPDWIELYNAGATAVDLSGHFLTDNAGDSTKWQIPAGTTISAGGFLLFWADDTDTLTHTNFKLTREGEEVALYSPLGQLLDFIKYTEQQPDVSFGRKTDGSAEWGYFTAPTPNASNNTTAYDDFVYSVPEFSVKGSFYNTPQTVELSTKFGGVIRYTLDGSEPTEASPAYTVPIPVNQTQIIRARIFKPGLIPGKVVTHSYFFDKNHELPVVSIASHPDYFWGTDGLYTQNFKPPWEYPINIELFENNGSDRAGFNLTAGVKVNGLNSWQLPQKMLGIYFRNEYGENKLEYPLFFDRNRTRFEAFILRASGSDWSYTLFRDGMSQNLTQPNMDVDIQGFRPCVVYINGEYMGIHNMRSRPNEGFVEENYGLESGTYDLIENNGANVEEGDLQQLNKLKTLLNKDLSIQTNFDAVAAEMDIVNFTDYLITEMYVGNRSIGHNVMQWKAKSDTSKWRWILMDLDRGLFNADRYLTKFFADQNVLPFGRLLQNKNYQQYFATRFADHLYTTFNAARLEKAIHQFKNNIEAEVPDHVDRWAGTTSSYGDGIPSVNYWYNEVCDLVNYAYARPGFVLDDLIATFNFPQTSRLSLITNPIDGGKIKLNGLTVPGSNMTGNYFRNTEIELTADEAIGQQFMGWAIPEQVTLIPEGTKWKYLDNGSDQGNAWKDTEFDDSGWLSGNAQFGYGDNDEATIVNYGSSRNKYVTTYFRHSFNVTDTSTLSGNLIISLIRDDGAVVYLNGEEIIRTNMPCSDISFNTWASRLASGTDERSFHTFAISTDLLKSGKNVLAVEIHQENATSSDLSFDLELVALKPSQVFISTEKTLKLSLNSDTTLMAVYEEKGLCLLPAVVTQNTTLTKACSPYLASGDVKVLENVNLTLEKGVEIWMPEDANILIHGNLTINGTASEPVIIKPHEEMGASQWGALCFINATNESSLSHLIIENASAGPIPIRDIAAISAFHSDLILDHITLEKVNGNPIFTQYSEVRLTNSSLHSKITGDLINVKYGNATIENCEFRGNKQPDTDAIDYDEVNNGIIRNCKIYNFFGFNSDGIDLGEGSSNILIENNLIYNCTDKAISAGQEATANVKNNTIVNCNLGLGLKDECLVTIDQNTFYSNAIPIVCYEKNKGSGGGHAIVKNSILSNSSDSTFLVDKMSSLHVSYSLSDNDPLPGANNNLLANPLFVNPTEFDFRLKPGSPGIGSGDKNGALVNMGTAFFDYTGVPSVMISKIFYDPVNPDEAEFLELYNPRNTPVDISGYEINLGVVFKFPPGVVMAPGESIFVTKEVIAGIWSNNQKQIFQWTKGNLANEGEAVQLTDSFGIVIDYVEYGIETPWPIASENSMVLTLISPDLDNHFPESWKTKSVTQATSVEENTTNFISIYPNPASSYLFIEASGYRNQLVELYNLQGKQLNDYLTDNEGNLRIDISKFSNNVLFVKVGGQPPQKVIVIR